MLVKYDSSGNAQWARTVAAGTDGSSFRAVVVDGLGNIYAAGDIIGTGTYTFGNGVSATGTYVNANVVLVKYDSGGAAQWAHAVTAGKEYSEFYSVDVDGSGNIYAAGYIFGTGTYTFGSGVSAAGTSSSANVVLVKYH